LNGAPERRPSGGRRFKPWPLPRVGFFERRGCRLVGGHTQAAAADGIFR